MTWNHLLKNLLNKHLCAKVNTCTSLSSGFLSVPLACIYSWLLSHLQCPKLTENHTHIHHAGQQCVGTYRETCYAQGGRPSVQISLLFPLGYISSLSPKTRKSRKKKKNSRGLNHETSHWVEWEKPFDGYQVAKWGQFWCCVWEVHQWQTMSKCLVTHKINHHRSQVLGSGAEVFLHIRPSQRPTHRFPEGTPLGIS